MNRQHLAILLRHNSLVIVNNLNLTSDLSSGIVPPFSFTLIRIGLNFAHDLV
jgi:hypothetical protein